MRYSLKNLCSMFTKQRLLALLLVLNIIVSCLVICFSYGLYQNYNVVLDQGEQDEYREINVITDERYITEGEYGMHLGGLTVSETEAFLTSLSPEIADNIKSVTCHVMLESDFRITENGQNGTDDLWFEFRVSGGKLVPSERFSKVLSSDDYLARRKIAAVSSKHFDPNNAVEMWLSYPDGTTLKMASRTLTEADRSISVGGESYELVILPKELDKPAQYSYSEDEVDISMSVFIPFTAIPGDTVLSLLSENSALALSFEQPLTRSQYNEIGRALQEAVGDKASLPALEFTEVSELYYYRTVILISVVIAVLAAVNMAILYRFILERRSRELAVMRVCGCSKQRAVLMYLAECMLVNIPVFALTELAYHKLLMPRLAEVFEHIEGAYSFKLYLFIFLIYTVASLTVMLIMICSVISKHSLVELKAKSSGRRSLIMKLFEVTQLGAVLVLLILICSTALSRYTLYEPFKDILESRGFMAYNAGGGGATPQMLFDALPGVKILNTCVGGYYLEDTGKQIDTLTYCDELIDRYKPELSEGIWLSESKDSYLTTGYMPAVVDAECEYEVGQTVIIPGYENGWDENGNVISRGVVKLRIIGRLKNNASVVSYPDYINAPVDHRNIYGTLNSGFEDNDFMLMRTEDMHSFTGRYTPMIGNQFVILGENDDTEQCKAVLSNVGGLACTSFEKLNSASRSYIFEQMKTIFPIALCIFILTVISSISISAIYTKRHLHTYAVLYICGATWRSCALRSLRAGLITCGVSAALTAAALGIGKLTFMKDTVITFGAIPLAVCAGVLLLYLALSMIMPLLIIGKTEPREVLKEE